MVPNLCVYVLYVCMYVCILSHSLVHTLSLLHALTLSSSLPLSFSLSLCTHTHSLTQARSHTHTGTVEEVTLTMSSDGMPPMYTTTPSKQSSRISPSTTNQNDALCPGTWCVWGGGRMGGGESSVCFIHTYIHAPWGLYLHLLTK